MTIKIAVPSETAADEKRVAASPDTIKKLVALGCEVSIQNGAGLNAAFTDEAFVQAGAKITRSHSETLKGAHIVLRVQAPNADELDDYKEGTILIGMLAPYNAPDAIQKYADHKIDAFSMELVPRITRAQAMDVLSSQSNLAGYKSVLDACEHFGRALPMMMTAAGTIAPAKVFVTGAGVAGLQAIATAKRLGAVVSATDVRPASKEQVQSLGGSFIAVEDEEFKQAETSGGYAKEMSPEYKAKQAALIEAHIAKQDIVITTALIPGRTAPVLVTEDMVKSMKVGSVIVDLAVESGGNCEISKVGDIIERHGVTIIGHRNVPSRLATDASSLYARNLLNLLGLLINKDNKILNIDWDDDIIKGIALTRGGKIIHPNFTHIEKSETETETKPKKKATRKTADKSQE